VHGEFKNAKEISTFATHGRTPEIANTYEVFSSHNSACVVTKPVLANDSTPAAV
jgi:hypothetical protein